MSDMEQLDKLLGNPKEVEAGGEKVLVSEVTMKNFKAFAAACAPFLHEFDEAGRLAERVDPETGDKKLPEEFALFRVLADHSEAFMLAATLVTNKPLSFYQRLTPDKFFDVAAAIVEVNGDFFVRSLAPSLLRMAKALGTIGTTASKR